MFKFLSREAFILFSFCKLNDVSWGVFDYKKSFVWKVLDSGNSVFRAVLTQFAHDLLDRCEFWVRISENNWNGIWVVKIGRFWASWCSRSAGRATSRRSVPPSSSSVFSCRLE